MRNILFNVIVIITVVIDNQSFEIDTPQDIYTCEVFMKSMLQQKGEA